MKTKQFYLWKALASFFFVLLMMPLGHALMILMEHFLSEQALHYCAFTMGAVGIALAVVGVFVKGDTRQTLYGLFGGLLFWTGWVEFLFQYFANRFGTQPQLDPLTGEILTRPEYLILPASFGFWAMVMLFYLFCVPTGCIFINKLQRHIFGKNIKNFLPRAANRHASIVTFMELNMIMWTSYLLLMFCYDDRFIGDGSPVTFVIGLLCLITSGFVFARQLRIASWGANIRMAIATVIIFWIPVEILGRNNFLTEIWIEPLRHIPEMLAFLAVFIVLSIYLWCRSRHGKSHRTCGGVKDFA